MQGRVCLLASLLKLSLASAGAPRPAPSSRQTFNLSPQLRPLYWGVHRLLRYLQSILWLSLTRIPTLPFPVSICGTARLVFGPSAQLGRGGERAVGGGGEALVRGGDRAGSRERGGRRRRWRAERGRGFVGGRVKVRRCNASHSSSECSCRVALVSRRVVSCPVVRLFGVCLCCGVV